MSVLHHYLIHGLVLATAVELPLQEIPPCPPDVTYALALDHPPMGIPSHSRPDDTDTPWTIDHWVGDQIAVEFVGHATFLISRERVLLVEVLNNDDDRLVHMLLDAVIPRVVAFRGDLMLHASGAVGPHGQALLFMGESGAGKSTLATALARAGWDLLDDDGIRIIDDDGELLAVPGYSSVRLLPDSAAQLLATMTPGRPMTRDHPKRAFAVDDDLLRMAAKPVVVAALFELERAVVDAPSIQRLGFADALGCVVEHAYCFADDPAQITRQAFERASMVAAAIPMWRLTYPASLDRLDNTVKLLIESCEQP